MAISIFDTVALIRVVENLKEPSQFLLDKFFPNTVQSLTEEVAIDVYNGQRRLAPFVNPLQEGKFVEQLGVQTFAWKPPYLKPKTRLDPLRPIRRMIGEQIGGREYTPAERAQMNLVREIAEHVNLINRRLEWMAANALTTATLTVQGEGVPLTSISFGRNASNSVALTGANRWGQSGVSPAQNLDAWSAIMLQTCGYPVTDVVFTPTAWRLFRSDPQVAQVIGSLVNGEASLRAGGISAQIGGQFLGRWGNVYDMWLYYDFYVDPVTGVEMPMIPDGTVILGTPNIDGVRAFAAIIDDEIGYPAIPYAPKSWTTSDPGARWLMTQSAPLVIPSRVNASFAATVI